MNDRILTTVDDDLRFWELTAAQHKELVAEVKSTAEAAHHEHLAKAADAVVAGLKEYLSHHGLGFYAALSKLPKLRKQQ